MRASSQRTRPSCCKPALTQPSPQYPSPYSRLQPRATRESTSRAWTITSHHITPSLLQHLLWKQTQPTKHLLEHSPQELSVLLLGGGKALRPVRLQLLQVLPGPLGDLALPVPAPELPDPGRDRRDEREHLSGLSGRRDFPREKEAKLNEETIVSPPFVRSEGTQGAREVKGGGPFGYRHAK